MIEPELKVNYSYQVGEKKDPALEAISAFSIKQEAARFSLDPATFDCLVGRYSYDVDKILTIKMSDGHLIYEIGDYTIFASGSMYPISATSFNTGSPQLSFRFSDFSDNQFRKIVIAWANETDTLIRLPDTYQSPSELVSQKKIDEALTIYVNAIAMGVHLAATTEAELNTLGYQLMAKNDFKTALKIFGVNTILFPFSGNAWDSLAEIWLKKGVSAKAIQYYRKSLELNPENRSAMEAMKILTQ
jgi:tetratricopeptide (TPR) repeat protein